MALARSAHMLAVMATGVLLAAPAWAFTRPDRAVAVAAGLTAQTLCAETFVSGLKPARVFRDSIASRPGLNAIAWGMRYQIDQQRQEVRVSWLGVVRARAVARGAAGCQLVLTRAPKPAPILEPMAGGAPAWEIGPANARIEAALDEAFAEPAPSAPRRVRAIVIVRDGRIIGERYADGVGPNTPLPGYSLTKTVVAALLGVAARQGRLKIEAPATLLAWRVQADQRGAITPDALLRMVSGLDAAETHSGFDPTSRMLFLERDMAGFAGRLRLKQAPGQAFAYQSANTLILSRILADLAGGDETDALNFARRELFSPLGMSTAVLQTDAVGTPVGSDGMLASARDWARLGELFLANGRGAEAQILPEGWVSYTTRPTLGGPYGAGLWLARAARPTHQSVITSAALPPDAFYASGDLGQRIYVVPSAHLVVVRLAASSGPDFGLRADMALLRAII